LSPWGRDAVQRLAADAAARGVKPAVVWHSGKLRARETAEAFWRACNPFAEFSASRDLQPGDSPEWMRDRLRGESRDVLIAGHYPHLPALLTLLTREETSFPQNGVVALRSDDEGETFSEEWRLDPRADPTRA
jgi:phosphohistidine phosphatase